MWFAPSLLHIMAELMDRDYEPDYMSESHYWQKYPKLYQGKYPIKAEVLAHEVNKFTQCDNSYAKRKYGWQPKIDIREGLTRTIRFTVAALEKAEGK